jgi:hypothetical protein
VIFTTGGWLGGSLVAGGAVTAVVVVEVAVVEVVVVAIDEVVSAGATATSESADVGAVLVVDTSAAVVQAAEAIAATTSRVPKPVRMPTMVDRPPPTVS